MRIIVKYSLVPLVIVLLVVYFWPVAQPAMVPVERVIHMSEVDTSVYRDMARLSFRLGDDVLAKAYMEKSMEKEWVAALEQKILEKGKLRQLIQRAMSAYSNQIEEEPSAFKRLVSVELVEETEKLEQGQLLLLLANMSLEQGFVGWSMIAKQLEVLSENMEGINSELSVLAHEISQYQVVEIE